MACDDIITHERTVGDTLTPVAATLKQENASGVLAAVNLTGLTVYFRMSDESGTRKVDDATATITSAADGQVQYDFAAADVDTAGTYFAWFLVEEAGTGTEKDTFPKDGATFRIIIHPKDATD